MTDYIKRKVALDIIAINYSISANDCCRIMCGAMFKLIEREPSADVAPVRHGKWEQQYPNSGLLKCSVCGYEYCDYIECKNFCGNCGAKMEENDGTT